LYNRYSNRDRLIIGHYFNSNWIGRTYFNRNWIGGAHFNRNCDRTICYFNRNWIGGAYFNRKSYVYVYVVCHAYSVVFADTKRYG
tara:strand:- start:699 stop:953 length:255 start_codon:yes stop_codon:yes gene_type:complete